MAHDCVCPVCGSTIGDLPVTLLPDRGMVVANGKFVVLTTREMAVLTRLAEVFPRVVSQNALLDWLYQLDIDGPPNLKIVDVFVCKIRKKLKPLGIRIDTSWGRGYALAVSEKPRVVEQAA